MQYEKGLETLNTGLYYPATRTDTFAVIIDLYLARTHGSHNYEHSSPYAADTIPHTTTLHAAV